MRGSGKLVRLGAGLLEAVVRPPYRNALMIIGIGAVMVGLFCAAYSLALGRVTPHHIGIGLVGRSAERPALVGALERATGGGLAFRPYPSAAAARTAIDQQAEYSALVLGPGPPRLLLSSASGASVALVLGQAAMRASQALGKPIPIVNLHPLPPGDPSGLVEFYATLAASIVGFVIMLHLRGNVPGISLGDWLALPPGATVDIIRTAVYFRSHQRAEPFLVQIVWLAGALAALLICVRLLGRRPGRPAALPVRTGRLGRNEQDLPALAG